MSELRPVVLVTGSATGVGRACTLRFAEGGCDIVVNFTKSESEALETARLVQETGARCLTIRCDVSDDRKVHAMIDEIEATWGRLDVLVNNAGCTHFVEHRDLDAMTESMWDRILAVNLKGPFFVTRAAAPLLKKAQHAAVVNVSSVAGINGFGSSIAYCASKGGLNTMTRSLARSLAPQIRVNSVCPGPVETRWLHSWMSDDKIARLTADYPIPRASQPEEIAEAVYYLARTAHMTTGQCLVIDGGRTM